MTKATRACEHCGASIAHRRSDARWCGDICMYRARHRRRNPLPDFKCVICGQSFEAKRTDAKYCSTACRSRKQYYLDLDATRARGRDYARRNAARRSSYFATYRDENRSLLIQYGREYHAANKEKANQVSREWRKLNPVKVLLYGAKRRAQKKSAGVFRITDRDIARLKARYGHRCAYCGVKSADLHLDHVFPISRGGRHSIGNLVPACLECNYSKRAYFITEWRLLLK